MNKYLFDTKEMAKKPYFTVSLSAKTPEETISVIRNAVFEGADAFLIHLEQFAPEYRTKETLEQIYSYTEDKPIMTLNYRSAFSSNQSDDERSKLQLLSVEAGAGCVDMMADYFDPNPQQMTYSKEAIKKQKEYIDTIHQMGGQVLISSHPPYKTKEELLEYMFIMQERSADIAKVAMRCDTQEQADSLWDSTIELKKQLDIPFLLIGTGTYGKAHRALAPVFGSCMVLCVQEYRPGFHKEKVLLKAAKSVYDNLDYKNYR
ncbi:MAG: type I 3-dehydroquinate dehydratase [Ruminococcaceae bacterium]|nr:type I 3-dehydroquinate dehydratase [Oscillospiraceae bacterium]